MMRRLYSAVAILSAILFVGVCVLWARSRTGWDRAQGMYCRYLPDKSIVSDELDLISTRVGVELLIMHGHAPPRPVDLVRGYDVNADESGGRPRLWLDHARDDGIEDWSYARKLKVFDWPIQFGIYRRAIPKDVDDSLSISLTVSHWLLALMLLAVPALWMNRFRRERRARRVGLCKKCGYDLRETPQRCPECGLVPG
jgi:hypothetical protein